MIIYIAIFFLSLFVIYKLSGALAGTFSGGGNSFSGRQLDVQELFFRTVFTLLGYVAKRDGPINQKEVKRTETFMEKMDLDAAHKREAIRLFKLGAEPQFDAERTIKKFQGLAHKSPNLAQILLVYLINLANVDGLLVSKEIDAVQKVAVGIGYSNIMFKHLLQMISSQNKFGDSFQGQNQNNQKQSNKTQDKNRQSENQKDYSTRHEMDNSSKSEQQYKKESESCEKKTKDFNNGGDQLSAAYAVFDVSENASDAEIKKSYRLMVNQYHPDKLTGQGLPTYMIQSSTECFQKIQAAYDFIKEARA